MSRKKLTEKEQKALQEKQKALQEKQKALLPFFQRRRGGVENAAHSLLREMLEVHAGLMDRDDQLTRAEEVVLLEKMRLLLERFASLEKKDAELFLGYLRSQAAEGRPIALTDGGDLVPMKLDVDELIETLLKYLKDKGDPNSLYDSLRALQRLGPEM